MRNILAILILLSLICTQTVYAGAKAKRVDTSGYDIAAEYVRSLSSVYVIQHPGADEPRGNTGGNSAVRNMMDSIRKFSSLKLELNRSARALEGMTLSRKPFDELLPMTVTIYQEKVKRFNEAAELMKKAMGATDGDVATMAKIAGRMPEITADLDYLDETLFHAMTLVSGLLMDMRTDDSGRLTHLNITTVQKQKLLASIEAYFDPDADATKKNWTYQSAMVLRDYLETGPPCVDEWQPH